jgi:hypothetical protein
MRWLLLILILLTGGLYAGYRKILVYPNELYLGWLQDKKWDKYYSLSQFNPIWMRPSSFREIPEYREDYAQLWKEFPLRNIRIPLPVRHPLFLTVPILESEGKKTTPHVGITLLAPNGRELSRVYSLPEKFLEDHSQGQELFKLPFVRNRILKIPQEKIWNDLFTFEINVKTKSIDEMIYDLYLLHLRSKILPAQTIRYGLMSDKRALIELESVNKDYIIELVMTNNSGKLLPFVLRTEINNDESRKIRSKFLDTIKFSPVDPAMGKFLYTEFKQLNFARQVDQEGMLYLFSSWSQDFENEEMFKDMVFFLERGIKTQAQLKPLYSFGLKHFGKTFSTRKVFTEDENQEVALERKIEIEKIEKRKEVQVEKERLPVEPELSPEEKMNLYLRKAKEEKQQTEKKDMTVH